MFSIYSILFIYSFDGDGINFWHNNYDATCYQLLFLLKFRNFPINKVIETNRMDPFQWCVIFSIKWKFIIFVNTGVYFQGRYHIRTAFNSLQHSEFTKEFHHLVNNAFISMVKRSLLKILFESFHRYVMRKIRVQMNTSNKHYWYIQHCLFENL